MKVLLLEDEQSIRDFVRINMKRQGYEVVEAASGEEALSVAHQHPDLDIAILDVMLPVISGFEVCQKLRDQYPRLGIIMLTAKGQEADKIAGLEYGADDYVVKPFSPAELVARVKSLYRRMHADAPKVEPKDDAVLRSHPFTLRLDERKLYKNSVEVDLTPKELEILKLLMENGDKAVSRDDILSSVWGKFYVGDLKIVDVNIRRIRQKIEEDASHPVYLETVWGYGYLWRKGHHDEGT
ncbi:DNA-binding response regulator [Brevibacillus fluminis]|uniref:DNA-binding response regulator n=1 Tax=Brevibacillus fluminis TaxID=511487 RepID=A0A3M8DT65_9BACL|nr:response regulator transcription factor [Brevibacillus fluminis]RNB91296.1 DNA-binding response regulator [Brevibacillus fluminis]